MRWQTGRLVTRTTLAVVVAVAVGITGSLAGAAYLLDNRNGSPVPPSVIVAPALAPLGSPVRPAGGPSASDLDVERAISRLVRDPALGTRLAGTVVDVATGRVLYDDEAGTPLLPASTAKLATATAALATLGPDRVLTTTTRLLGAGTSRPTVVLVGGGDPTLTTRRAGPATYPRAAPLRVLARRTVAALGGITDVRVAVDDRLFTGPRTGPGWKPTYVPEGDVAPVTALETNDGRAHPSSDTDDSRYPDPSLAAGAEFAHQVGRYGVRVVGPVTRRVAGGRHLASLASPPVAALVAGMLQRSDNDLAEALARHVALAEHRPATFTGAAQAVAGVLARLGVRGVHLVDGSGLSLRDRVTPSALVALLRVDARRPALRPVLAGLAVAGVTGTLVDRFRRGDRGRPAAGSGVVHAKTGTLTGVSALAGLTPDRGGRLLAFAFIGTGISPVGTLAAERALDRIAGAIARCCPV